MLATDYFSAPFVEDDENQSRNKQDNVLTGSDLQKIDKMKIEV